MGELVYFLDRVLGEKGDLCSKANQMTIASDAKAGKVLGSMLAPPCSSHSRIQQIAAAGPLRTPEHPCGVPGLDGVRLERVRLGNRTARAAARLCLIFWSTTCPSLSRTPP